MAAATLDADGLSLSGDFPSVPVLFQSKRFDAGMPTPDRALWMLEAHRPGG